MDLQLTDRADARDWVDVPSCTLPTVERPLRLAEFDDLFATSLCLVERTDDTAARLTLAGDAGLAERTQALADAESICCSFFTFGVAPLDNGGVAFDVSVPPRFVDVLDALVVRATSALGGVA